MFPTVNTEFNGWLLKELEKRDWTQSDLARASGLSRGFISNLLNDMRQPGADACVAIAAALKIPPEVVLRKAGILPEKSENSPRADEALHLFNQLNENDQDEVIEFMLMKRRRSEMMAEANALATALDSIPPDDVDDVLRMIDEYLKKHGLRRVK